WRRDATEEISTAAMRSNPKARGHVLSLHARNGESPHPSAPCPPTATLEAKAQNLPRLRQRGLRVPAQIRALGQRKLRQPLATMAMQTAALPWRNILRTA